MTYARVAFDIPGAPFAKQRPRMTRSGRAYTPAATVSYERTVGTIALQHCPKPFTGPVRLTVKAVFPIPQSWSRKKREEHIWRAHTQRPDFDNVLKAICDGLNAVAFADDAQIAECTVTKTWGERGNVVVVVEALTEQPCSP